LSKNSPRTLKAELDYEAEARNAEKFAELCRGRRHVRVPSIHRDYCTSRVLTMDYVDGIKLSDRERLEEAGLSARVLAERYAAQIFRQTLVDGFFHGDPHPGNVVALPDGSLGWFDFGMMGRCPRKRKSASPRSSSP